MASWKSCVASSNGMWCRQRLRCSLTVSALACAALLAADGASAQGEPQLEPCPGGGYNPTPTVVEVAAVPIVVESATTDYFVLYVSHEVDADTTVDIPVLVKRGEADTTTTWRRCPRNATGAVALPDAGRERGGAAQAGWRSILSLTRLTLTATVSTTSPSSGIRRA